MPKICYIEKKFDEYKTKLIRYCDRICSDYALAGYDLTLRQLYYQLVSQNVIPNLPEEYDRLSVLISDARLAGLIDWDHIVDRTRNVMSIRHWDKPSQLIKEAAESYAIDKWLAQKHYIEVWIEKQALEGVFERICNRLDIPFFSCRGYVSQSEMWAAAYRRLVPKCEEGKAVHIIHFGDHDPSGIDMSRDIKERLSLFMAKHTTGEVHVLRAALNMAQIKRLKPPPNPAKVTDSRAKAYIALYGTSSWELDSLNPRELSALVSKAVLQYRDELVWQKEVEREKKGRSTLQAIYDNFLAVVKFLRNV